MKQIITSLFSLFILITLSQCSSKEEHISNTLEFNSIKLNVKEIGLVKLQKPPVSGYLNPTISRIDELQNMMILYDRSTKTIMRYDLQGNFINTIGNQGEAPFEYYQVDDMHLAGNGEIYSFSIEGMKFNVFKPDGRSAGYHKLNYYGLDFELRNQHIVLNTGYNFSEQSGKNTLLLLDTQFQISSRHIPIDEVPSAVNDFSGFFLHDQKNALFYFSHGMSDSINVFDKTLNRLSTIKIEEVENKWPHGFDYYKIFEDPKAIEYSFIASQSKIVNDLAFISTINKRLMELHVFDFRKEQRINFADDMITFIWNYLIPTHSEQGVFYCLLTDEFLAGMQGVDLDESIDKNKYPMLYKILDEDLLNEGPILYSFQLQE